MAARGRHAGEPLRGCCGEPGCVLITYRTCALVPIEIEETSKEMGEKDPGRDKQDFVLFEIIIKSVSGVSLSIHFAQCNHCIR